MLEADLVSSHHGDRLVTSRSAQLLCHGQLRLLVATQHQVQLITGRLKLILALVHLNRQHDAELLLKPECERFVENWSKTSNYQTKPVQLTG